MGSCCSSSSGSSDSVSCSDSASFSSYKRDYTSKTKSRDALAYFLLKKEFPELVTWRFISMQLLFFRKRWNHYHPRKRTYVRDRSISMPPSKRRGTQCQSLNSYTASQVLKSLKYNVQWDTATPLRPPTFVDSANVKVKHDPPQSDLLQRPLME
ncbi:hypothetical protein BD770DRAFT_423771 [Pilaira anomala]|nr:hypothetical protein BD770DRAFT_423771 [Pilaira anomala]